MKKPEANLILFSLLVINLLFVPVVNAQDFGLGVYMDQDLFVPITDEDRDYTMGMAVEFFWSKEMGLPLDDFVESVASWVGIDENEKNIVYSFTLGSIAFTPDDLSNSKPIFNDRPYSSLVYLTNKRVHADGKTALAAEVMVGVIGTSFAKNVQTQLHEWYRSLNNSDQPVEPMGWDNQISDGGELTMRVRLTNAILHSKLSKTGIYDVSSSYGLSLGFQTNARASVTARVGDIHSAFWTTPFDPVKRGSFIPTRAKKGWYFWSAFRIHAVLYDALLQGQFRDSNVEYAANQIEPLVYDAGAGFTWTFEKSQLTIATNSKSPDLKFVTRHQVWGSVHYIIHF